MRFLLGLTMTTAAQVAANFARLDAATVDGCRFTAGDTFATQGARIAALDKKLRPKGLPAIFR
ncbi:hypothetical protein VA596_41080 [Amycolatopsis sp., V23-08]|uniref:Uncharacterized protein n=1 Tax=Amycolatopsis heterodermiae TaxID=3110235 RepID=A0ABU5RK82_9PSEU|nr:hypothetical protein [Amycolatopsis sp., V23-08]MEA5365979.1 hypothetical protein [Amycolatopsis sp., V23-08]